MKLGAILRPIRSFSSEGLPRRRYAVSDAEWLIQRKIVVAVRNRRGEVVSIHFYGESRIPIKSRLKAGTRYSYQEVVGLGHRRWDFSRVYGPDERRLDYSLSRDQYRRQYQALESEPFRAVQISVTKS